MREKDRIKPGDIFISDDENSIVHVGVIIGIEFGDTIARTLVFGRIPDESGVKLRQFPAYENFKMKDVRAYDFSRERNFYRQNSWPEDSLALTDIDIAQHLLGKGTIENYKWSGSVCNEHFLLVQAVLHGYFPGCVKAPPEKMEIGNMVLMMYYTTYGKPYVVTMFRGEEDLAQQHEEGC